MMWELSTGEEKPAGEEEDGDDMDEEDREERPYQPPFNRSRLGSSH